MFIPDVISQQGNKALQFNQEVSLGTHLQAGGRAELIATPLTEALCSRRGRLLARTMKALFRGNMDGLLNYAAFRPYAVAEAIRIALDKHPENKVVLDPATGFSPVFYWLAEEFTDTQFVEVDVHEIVEFKRSVYYQFGIPSNLRLRPIDLKIQRLHEVQTNAVDVMVTVGAYITHDEFRELLKYLGHLISAEGCLIVPFPYAPGIDNFTDNSFIFTNIISTPKGAILHYDEFESIFANTDFELEKTIKLSELAQELGKPIPADIEMIAIARRK